MTQSATLSSSPTPQLFRMPGLALQKGKGNFVDELMAIGVFVILPLDFPMAQPLRAPFTLLLLVYLALQWRDLLPLLWRGRWFFALPAMCYLSALWADNWWAAVRYGNLIGLTMIIAAAFAIRLSPRQIAVVVLLSQGALAIGSAVTMTSVWIGGIEGGYALVGVFPHKNVLAQRMVFLCVASLAILLTPGYRHLWRLIAIGAMALALFLIAQAMSATAVILLLGAIPMAIILGLVWRPAGYVRGLRPAIVMGGIMLATLGSLLIFNVYQIDPVNDGLEVFGKDETLTGRTVIWATGNKVITENPLLGVGAGNFWHADNPTAVRLADRFWVANGNFRFHNAYYEVTVHLGLLGLAVALYAFGRGFLLIVTGWWRQQQRADLFFIVLSAVLFIRSFTESELFYAMVLGPLLFWLATFSALEEKPAARASAG